MPLPSITFPPLGLRLDLPFLVKCIALGGGLGFAYALATAFRPSARITSADVVAGGGLAFVAPKSGRLIEYFLHGKKQEPKTVLLAFHGAQTTGNLYALVDRWALDNDVLIVAPTLPGFGLTPYTPCTVEEWTADVTELLAQLKVTRFHVVGTSLGSIHAAALASLYQPNDAVRNVALYVAFAPQAEGEHDPLQGSVLAVFGNLRRWPLSKRLLEKLLFLPLLRLFTPRNTDVARSIRWQWEGAAMCADQIYAPWRFNWTTLSNGGRRVLVISGKQDAVAPPHNQQRLHAKIAGSVLVEFDGAHERPITEPALFAKHLSMLIA